MHVRVFCTLRQFRNSEFLWLDTRGLTSFGTVVSHGLKSELFGNDIPGVSSALDVVLDVTRQKLEARDKKWRNESEKGQKD